MRRKLTRYGIVVAIIGVMVAWWFWPRQFLTDELVSQVKEGMSAQEVIQLLGPPTSDRYRAAIERKVKMIEVNGAKVSQQVAQELLEPKSAWHPHLIIENPPYLSVDDWRKGKLLFWADQTRLFWIKLDGDNMVKEKLLASVASEGGGLKSWVSQQWSAWIFTRPATPVRTMAYVSSTRAVPAPVQTSAVNIPPASSIAQTTSSQNGKCEFVAGPRGPVMHTINGMGCVGMIDKNGDFQPNLDDLERAIEAHNRGVPRVGVSWPPDLVHSLKPDEKLFEYRKGYLVPMVNDKNRGLIPETGGKIIEFKDYEYSPTARRIYNLPGRFVLKDPIQEKEANIMYEYVEDLTIVYYQIIDSIPTAGYLNSEGKFVASDAVKGPAQQLTGGALGEPLYEYHAGKLILGKFKTGGESPEKSGPLNKRAFFPDPDGKVIVMDEYLRDYVPRKSPRIYNLPGRIVQKEEKK